MKFTKKMAAMIAGMMTIAAMGGMTAFADTITNESDTDQSGNKSVSLPLTVTSGLQTVNAYQSTPTWNVEVSAPPLTWSLSGTKTTTYTLTWDPSAKSYSPVSGNPVETYSDGTGTFEGKTVNITNNSNFAVSAGAVVSDGFGLNTSSIASIAGAGGTDSFTITPSSELRDATTGTATFTFARTGDLIQYNSTNVTDTTTVAP